MSVRNPTVDTNSFEAIAKESYPVDEIKRLEQNETALLKEIPEVTNLTFSAKNDGSFIFAVKAAQAHGQKMINQKEQLPQGKPSQIVNGTAYIKEYAGVIEFTKRELTLAKNNALAFSNAKTFEMESLIQSAGKYKNRQIANGLGTGIMTLIQGTQAIDQTVIEVDDACPFQIGMLLDFWNAAGTSKENANVIVVDIDILSSPNTITLQDGLVVQSEDNGIICIAGARDNMSADGKEMIGLPLVTDDGTLATSFQGIVRSGTGEVPNYRGITLDANGAPLGHAVVAQLMTRAHRIGGINFNDMNDVFWCLSPEQFRNYQAEAIPEVILQPTDAMDLAKGYTSKLTIAGKRVVQDTDVDRNSAYLIRKGALKMAVAHALDWESDLGAATLKWVSGTPQGMMLLYGLFQMFAESPREIVRVENLASVAI